MVTRHGRFGQNEPIPKVNDENWFPKQENWFFFFNKVKIKKVNKKIEIKDWWTTKGVVRQSSITAGVPTAASTLMLGQGVKKAPFADVPRIYKQNGGARHLRFASKWRNRPSDWTNWINKSNEWFVIVKGTERTDSWKIIVLPMPNGNPPLSLIYTPP